MEIAGFSFVGQARTSGWASSISSPGMSAKTPPTTSSPGRTLPLQRKIHDAQVYSVNLPTVRGLGQFGGFDLYLQDRAGVGREALTRPRRT